MNWRKVYQCKRCGKIYKNLKIFCVECGEELATEHTEDLMITGGAVVRFLKPTKMVKYIIARKPFLKAWEIRAE